MLTLKPLHLAAAVAIALSGTAALAQSTSTSTSGDTTATTTTAAPGVPGAANASASTPGASSAGGSAMGTNQTTVDPATTRPGSFDPGGAFGPPATNTAQGTSTVPTTLPGTTGAVVLPADTALTGNPTQQNVIVQSQQPSSVTAPSTPLFDQVAREGQAKESRRRAQGNEPRIIGIAPRTDRDLTHQMPDDRIIRY